MNVNLNYKMEINIHRERVLFSVIIPAHNAEKTLRRAVESALGVIETVEKDATLSSLKGTEQGHPGEILIIENGSEDGTEFLARNLQAEHPQKVRFFRSEKGVSNARNKGLENAAGDWVLFLDADDYFLETAGAVLRDDLHFSGTDLIVHSFDSGGRQVHLCPADGERFAADELAGICVRMIENPTRYTTVWSKLFRRERIVYGKLFFDPALRLSEDSDFLIRYLAVCRRIRLIDRPFYHYSTDNVSAVRTWDGKKEEGYREALLKVQAFLKTQPAQIRKAFYGYGMMQFNLLMVREVFSLSSPFTLSQKIARMKQISQKEPFASAIEGYDPHVHRGLRYLPIRMLRKGCPAGAAAVYQGRVLQNLQKEKQQ